MIRLDMGAVDVPLPAGTPCPFVLPLGPSHAPLCPPRWPAWGPQIRGHRLRGPLRGGGGRSSGGGPGRRMLGGLRLSGVWDRGGGLRQAPLLPLRGPFPLRRRGIRGSGSGSGGAGSRPGGGSRPCRTLVTAATMTGGRGYVATRPTCGPPVILPPALTCGPPLGHF